MRAKLACARSGGQCRLVSQARLVDGPRLRAGLRTGDPFPAWQSSDKSLMQISPWMAASAAAVLVLSPCPARAQSYEDVGTRAQGMGGAFVAVADDATASWWNPAGLATGAYFNVVVEKSRSDRPETPVGLEPARRAGSSGFAVAFPALGLSYYRLRISQIGGDQATGPAGLDRQALGGPGSEVRSLAVRQFGVTVGQSVGRHLVLGSTLKLLRGGVATAPADSSGEGLDIGDDLPIREETHGDLDVGAMVTFQHARLGVSVRNLTQPSFGEGADRAALRRQARAGLAVVTNSKGAQGGLTISADADLTRTATPFGDVRHLAAGGEVWLIRKRLGVRGGLTANTIGDARLATSTGISVAPTASFFIEGARTFGSDGSTRGWSATTRVTF